jgi:hypothetical protein
LTHPPVGAWLDAPTLAVVAEARDRLTTPAGEWRLTEDDAWVTAVHEPSGRPDQGWKLHVAAGVLTARAILARSLEVLFGEDADFKVAASLRQLARLNDGRCGLTQVGKFITVYPRDDAQAVRLAQRLDAANGARGAPTIPSDRPLRPGSVVHYRYGGFGDLQMRTPLGELLPAVRAPDGTLEPDRRLPGAPAWATDPFTAAGIADGPDEPSRMIGGRYAILAVLHTSPRSRVCLCLDVTGPSTCVVKRVTFDGNGSVDRLRREHAALTRLAPDPRFPRRIALVEEPGGLCLVMEDVEGRTLARHLASLRERNVLPSRGELVTWARQLAAMLEAIHERGLVYGDLKASNVMITPAGALRLVDFELAQELGGDQPETVFAFGRGSRGHMSPQQIGRHAPSVADDVYGLGAVLYLIATGAEPSFAPDPSALLDRPIELLNPDIGPALAEAIGRCLDRDPRRRPASPARVAAALEEALDAGPGDDRHASAAQPPAGALELARRIGDLLAEGLDRPPSPVAPLDLNMGGAGAVLVLAEIVAEFGDPVHREGLARGARGLRDAPRAAGVRLPGLYVGEAGIGAALLRAGQVLGDADLIGAAAEAGRWVAAAPHDSPDLFHGTAGRLRFHLWLWRETGDGQYLDHAVEAADRLLAADMDKAGAPDWTLPPGYESLSGRRLTGYAHGAAGIADALLDLFDTTGAAELLDAARSVRRWLAGLAEPALADGSGINWPGDEDSRPTMAFWCHGAAGIARFLVHLAESGAEPEALDTARAAARTVARGTRWAGPTQCHGLASGIECLLDVHQATGEEAYLADAGVMVRLLHAFAVERRGRLTLVTDLDRSDQGFTIGYAGIAACLLRAAQPRTRAHLLSLDGFRATASAGPAAS